jgi:sigma-B regulation protein RsbU (phosphoserine phosphatase)
MIPDLILLDIMMPGENGFECALALRLSPETSEIPIIFLTALDDDQNTARSFDTGAVDYIVKPFEYRDVLNRIRTHLLIAERDRKLLAPQKQIRTAAKQPSGEMKSHSAVFPDDKTAGLHIYESVALPQDSEGHLIIDIPDSAQSTIPQGLVSKLLAENSGPVFTPSMSMRNIGLRLIQELKMDMNLSGVYIAADRPNKLLTIVNAGAMPVIYQAKGKPSEIVERQSGAMGSLGLGLPPCKTFSFEKGDRVFIVSKEMLSAFSSPGEGVMKLRKACELSAGVDIETACMATGEIIQDNADASTGILVAMEG